MTIGKRIAEYLPNLPRDAAGLSGVGLVSYGAWLWFHPAGFIVAGGLLLGGAVLSAWMASE